MRLNCGKKYVTKDVFHETNNGKTIDETKRNVNGHLPRIDKVSNLVSESITMLLSKKQVQKVTSGQVRSNVISKSFLRTSDFRKWHSR